MATLSDEVASLSAQMQKLTAAVSNLVLSRSLQGTFDMRKLPRNCLTALKLDHLVKDEHQVFDENLAPIPSRNLVQTPKTNPECDDLCKNKTEEPSIKAILDTITSPDAAHQVFDIMPESSSCLQLVKQMEINHDHTHHALVAINLPHGISEIEMKPVAATSYVGQLLMVNYGEITVCGDALDPQTAHNDPEDGQISNAQKVFDELPLPDFIRGMAQNAKIEGDKPDDFNHEKLIGCDYAEYTPAPTIFNLFEPIWSSNQGQVSFKQNDNSLVSNTCVLQADVRGYTQNFQLTNEVNKVMDCQFYYDWSEETRLLHEPLLLDTLPQPYYFQHGQQTFRNLGGPEGSNLLLVDNISLLTSTITHDTDIRSLSMSSINGLAVACCPIALALMCSDLRYGLLVYEFEGHVFMDIVWLEGNYKLFDPGIHVSNLVLSHNLAFGEKCFEKDVKNAWQLPISYKEVHSWGKLNIGLAFQEGLDNTMQLPSFQRSTCFWVNGKITCDLAIIIKPHYTAHAPIFLYDHDSRIDRTRITLCTPIIVDSNETMDMFEQHHCDTPICMMCAFPHKSTLQSTWSSMPFCFDLVWFTANFVQGVSRLNTHHIKVTDLIHATFSDNFTMEWLDHSLQKQNNRPGCQFNIMGMGYILRMLKPLQHSSLTLEDKGVFMGEGRAIKKVNDFGDNSVVRPDEHVCYEIGSKEEMLRSKTIFTQAYQFWHQQEKISWAVQVFVTPANGFDVETEKWFSCIIANFHEAVFNLEMATLMDNYISSCYTFVTRILSFAHLGGLNNSHMLDISLPQMVKISEEKRTDTVTMWVFDRDGTSDVTTMMLDPKKLSSRLFKENLRVTIKWFNKSVIIYIFDPGGSSWILSMMLWTILPLLLHLSNNIVSL